LSGDNLTYIVYTIESVLPVCDKPYHTNNGFQQTWAEIKKNVELCILKDTNIYRVAAVFCAVSDYQKHSIRYIMLCPECTNLSRIVMYRRTPWLYTTGVARPDIPGTSGGQATLGVYTGSGRDTLPGTTRNFRSLSSQS